MNAPDQVNSFADQRHRISDIQQRVIARGDSGDLLAGEFQRRVAGIAGCLLQRPEQRWALVCDDTLWFAAGFLALAQARKTLILPQTGGPESAAEAQAAAVLTDQPARFPSFASVDVTAVPEAGAPVSTDLDDALPVELYTSGSTGRPKRVDKLLGQLRAEVTALEARWGPALGDALVLGSVPHHHLYGLLFRVLWPLWAGRPLYAPVCAQAHEFKAAARRFGRCLIVSSPAFLTRVTDFAMLQPPDAFAALFSSGAPLPAATAAKIAGEMGRAAIEVYGSTETGGIAWRTWEPERGQTAWQPFAQLETALLGATPGLLRVRSPWTWKADWMDTDDLAQMLPQRRFLLCGRADSVLKVEDKRVSLAEMERRLVAHGFVSEARLLVLKGKRSSVGAVVVLSTAGRRQLGQTGTRSVRKALMDWLRAWYDPVLVPRKWRFREAMPDNAMGKIEQAELQALFTERR